MRVSSHLAIIVAVLSLASCTHVMVLGSHRTAVSREDIRKIQRLVSHRSDLQSGALFIRPLSADVAAIQSGSSADEDTDFHTFTVRRVADVWKVEDATIRTQRARVLH